jgi:hypothetical protein
VVLLAVLAALAEPMEKTARPPSHPTAKAAPLAVADLAVKAEKVVAKFL